MSNRAGRIAANVATILFIVIIILQLLLALGILESVFYKGDAETLAMSFSVRPRIDLRIYKHARSILQKL